MTFPVQCLGPRIEPSGVGPFIGGSKVGGRGVAGSSVACRLGRVVPICLAALVATPTSGQGPDEGLQRLAEQVDLARLVDLCTERLGLRVEYDPKDLKAAVVTLRLRDPVSDAELWAITNQLLASRGFAAVQMPGSDLISITKAATAQSLARVEGREAEGMAGYITLLYELEHREVKEILEAIRPLLSKPAGTIGGIGPTKLLLISDYKPRIDQAIDLIKRLDVPPPEANAETIPAEHVRAEQLASVVNAAAAAYTAVTGIPLKGKLNPLPQGDALLLVAPESEVAYWRSLVRELDLQPQPAAVETIPVQYLDASKLAALIGSATTAYGAVTGAALKGKLLPSPDGRALVLVAPPGEAPQWRGLIERFDSRQAVQARSYSPKYFPVREVSQLIESVARDPSPRGSGEQWKVVSDELTGTLIVTATPSEHEQTTALIERLDSVPGAAQRPVRAFPIRNRNVTEILDVLNRLIEAGVLESTQIEAPEPSPMAPAEQRSERQVLPPGAEPVERPSLGQPPAARAPAQQPRGAAAGTRTAGATSKEAAVTLTADEGTNTLIASGDPRRLAQLEQLIRTLDVRQPQVMLEALVVTLSDVQTLDLGVELESMNISGATFINLASLFGLDTPGTDSDGEVTGRGGTVLVLDPGDFRILIRALETINKGRVLNLPKVLVSNNQEAKLDSVLQQPFSTVNASTTVATTAFGGTQDAGTTLTVKPQIAEGDQLVLEYSVSLSSFVGTSSDPALPPPRQQNNITSVATIPDGYVVVVGGLETITNTESVSQVPLLGDIPLLGEAFKRRSNNYSLARFFVFIRASVLRQGQFEDLKYLSDRDVAAAGIDDGWPEVEPRLIR